MSVKGVDKLMKQFNKLGNINPVVEKAIQKECLRVQRSAVMLCPANNGELRQSIKVKVDAQASKVTGTVYTNKEYASYVEFGTGPIGEEKHQGISPDISPVYSQNGWWFQGDDIKPQDARKYYWIKSEGAKGTFYYTKGQPAQPFLYPALKKNENIITMNLGAALQVGIKGGM